jgi:hypothetical protein
MVTMASMSVFGEKNGMVLCSINQHLNELDQDEIKKKEFFNFNNNFAASYIIAKLL